MNVLTRLELGFLFIVGLLLQQIVTLSDTNMQSVAAVETKNEPHAVIKIKFSGILSEQITFNLVII